MPELLPSSPDNTPDVTALLSDLRRLINEARERAAVAVNRELTLMHWHIGDHIRRDILQEERVAYGERISRYTVATIDDGVWTWFQHENLAPYDAVCGGFS